MRRVKVITILVIMGILSFFPSAINASDKKYYFEPQYDYLGMFHNGLAIISVNEKQGIIDKYNKIILSPIYDYIYSFEKGIAIISIEDEIQAVDFYGNYLFSLQYDSAYDIIDGKILVKKDKRYGLITTKGQEILPCQYIAIEYGESDNVLIETEDDSWNLINITSKEVIKENINSVTVSATNKYIFCISKGKFGIIDFNGNSLTNFKYDYIYDVSNGYFRGVYGDHTDIIDINGNITLTVNSQGVSEYSDGVIAINSSSVNKSTTKYIDINGNDIVNPSFSKYILKAESYHDGYALIMHTTGGYSYIDKKGDIPQKNIYDYAYGFARGYALIGDLTFDEQGEYYYNKWYIIDKEFNRIIDIDSLNCNLIHGYISNFSDGFVHIEDRESGKVGFIYLENNTIEISDTLKLTESSTYEIDDSGDVKYLKKVQPETKVSSILSAFMNAGDTVQIVNASGTIIQPTDTTTNIGTGYKVQLLSGTDVIDEITVIVSGDTTGDGVVNSADAIYLLRYTLFPSMYPIIGTPDYNKDGVVNSTDAIYLLRHTLFPSIYPLD